MAFRELDPKLKTKTQKPKAMNIIDGKKISKEVLAKVKEEVSKLPFTPVFCDILVGEDPASAQYVKMKGNTAESVGIHFHNANFPSTITSEELIEEIKKINKIPNMCGVIIQLPLPLSIDKRQVLDAIDPALDVDCLGTPASLEFYSNKSKTGFPTALACMALVDSLNFDLNGKSVVVMGQGELVGKPVKALLEFRNCIPNVITRKTENKEELMKNADLIITGMGQGKYIKGEMLKEGVVIIDAGTSESNNAIVGDVDLDSVANVASYVSPVPGGVGPMTVAMLLQNVLKVAKNLK